MMKSLVPTGARGLDAGCGGGAGDLFSYWQEGYDVFGLDAVAENIEVAQQEHPEIAERVFVADLTEPLDFPDAFFDFVSCNAQPRRFALRESLNAQPRRFALRESLTTN